MRQQATGTEYLIRHVIDVIRETYGDDVSVEAKAKDLHKFGRNISVNTGPATIMDLGSGETAENYVSTNAITHFASGTDADTSLSFVVEGHTISGGLLTFATQTVTTDASAARTKTALTTPLARITRAYGVNATTPTGPIYFAEDVTFTNGVPVAGNTHLIIPAGKNQTRKASTSLSNQDYWIITNFYADVFEKTAGFAIVELQHRQVGSAFREVGVVSASNTGRGIFPFEPFYIIPKNSDVRLQAETNADIDVGGGIHGFLAKVIT